MKKLSVLAVLLLVFVLAISGCAEKNDTPSAPNSTEGSGSQSTAPVLPCLSTY